MQDRHRAGELRLDANVRCYASTGIPPTTVLNPLSTSENDYEIRIISFRKATKRE